MHDTKYFYCWLLGECSACRECVWNNLYCWFIVLFMRMSFRVIENLHERSPFFLLLWSSRRKVIFEKLLQRQNLLKFGVVLPQYPTLFHHSPPNVRSYKAAAWLVQRVGGSLCMHISLFLICFLPFIFSLLYVCNCLFTTVTKFNYSSCLLYTSPSPRD